MTSPDPHPHQIWIGDGGTRLVLKVEADTVTWKGAVCLSCAESMASWRNWCRTAKLQKGTQCS